MTTLAVDEPTRSAGRTVARNSTFTLVGQIALKTVSFISTLAIVRGLGDDDFGRYAAAIAFVGIFSVCADLGIASYAVRMVSRDHAAAPWMLGNLIAMRVALSLVAFVITMAFASLLGYPSSMLELVALASTGVVLYSVLGAFEAILEGFERYDVTTVGRVLNQMTFNVTALIVLWFDGGPDGIIAASYVGVVIATIYAWRLVRRLMPVAIRFDVHAWYPLARAGLPFAISTFAMLLSFRADTVLLSLWRTPEEVGWYSVAYNLIFTLIIPISSFTAVLVPSLTRQYGNDPARIATFYVRAMRYVWMLALPMAAGVCLLSREIIALLFGRDYSSATTALQFLAWTLPVLAITMLCGSFAIVVHREARVARLNLLNAAFNIVLNLWAIRQFGLIGAAALTVLTEAVGLTQYVIILRDVIPRERLRGLLLAPVPAVLLMAGCVALAATTLPLVLVVAGGAAVYGVGLLATGAVTIAELRLLPGMMSARRHGGTAAAGQLPR